jgi:sulfate transport system ATP-binding protein
VNVFRGRVENGQAWVRDLPLPVEGLLGRSGAAKVYVRPHDLEIERHRNGHPALEASVQRIQAAGAVVKIGLQGADGDDIQVDLSQDRFERLALRSGDTVYVSPKKARVFAPDYVI